jgi:hypothetical protein
MRKEAMIGELGSVHSLSFVLTEPPELLYGYNRFLSRISTVGKP